MFGKGMVVQFTEKHKWTGIITEVINQFITFIFAQNVIIKSEKVIKIKD